MQYFVLPFLALFIFVNPALAKVTEDVSYGILATKTLDIYAPKKAKRAPVMVYVHGGAWAMGDKKHVGVKPHAFNEEGYIFVSIGYPLLPKHGVGEQAQSVADAIVWVEKNIGEYGGNPKEISIMGHSAGAHLVALVATDGRYMEKAGSSASNIQYVVSVDGAALDVPSRMRDMQDEPEPVQQAFYNAFGREPTKWQDFSPLHYAEQKKDQPRFLMLTGNREVAWDAAHNFVARLGRKNKVVLFPDKNHRQINLEIGQDGDLIFEEIMRFID